MHNTDNIWIQSNTVYKFVCFSSQGKDDRKGSKYGKSSESAEKSSKAKDGSKSAVEHRLIQLAMTVPQGGDSEVNDAVRRKAETEQVSGTTRGGSRHVKTDTDKVRLSTHEVGTKDRRKSDVEPKGKSSGGKLQHKTKDSSLVPEKDKSSLQSGRKTGEARGKGKPRTESTSSASSDSSSSSSSSSSSGTSSSGSSSSTSSSSSAMSSPQKPRQQRSAAKSKSDAQSATTAGSGSKTRRSKDVAAKSADKVESGKLSGKSSSRRPKEKSTGNGQRESTGFRGSNQWKEEGEVGGDRHRVTSDGRKEGRERSGREEHSRDDDLEPLGTPGSDRRLPHDASVDYRQDRASVRYSGEHRRSGRYEADEHYDRLQHPADYEVTDRYRQGRYQCH